MWEQGPGRAGQPVPGEGACGSLRTVQGPAPPSWESCVTAPAAALATAQGLRSSRATGSKNEEILRLEVAHCDLKGNCTPRKELQHLRENVSLLRDVKDGERGIFINKPC